MDTECRQQIVLWQYIQEHTSPEIKCHSMTTQNVLGVHII